MRCEALMVCPRSVRVRVLGLLMGVSGAALLLGNGCGGTGNHPGDASAALDAAAGSAGHGGGTGSGGIGGMGGGGGRGGMGGDCPFMPLPCYYYGNGRLDPDEECDDGNLAYGDGCNAIGKVEPYWECPSGLSCQRLSRCGDGILGRDEICDDGLAERSSGHGCSADCQTIEPGWYCPFVGKPCLRTGVQPGAIPSCDAGECPVHCGNGIVEGNEECDLGDDLNNDNSYGGCNTMCRLGPRCGDGEVNGDEGCDLGTENGVAHGDAGAECTRVCKQVPTVCGDWIVNPAHGEACDLGELNGRPEMPCSVDCQIVPISCLALCM